MPFSTAATDAITRRAPKFISPKAHAVIDYLMIGTFFVTGALFWRRNRRAAISALMCGGAELTNTLFTDYPGGVAPVISFPFHRKIDFGLAAMTATISSQNRLRSRRHDGHHAGIHVFPRSS